MVIFGNKNKKNVIRCAQCSSFNVLTLSFHKAESGIFEALVMCDDCGQSQKLSCNIPGTYKDSKSGLNKKIEAIKEVSKHSKQNSRMVY